MIHAEKCRDAASGSIAGGFVPVPVTGLMAAWRACRSGPLGIGDFRAWLACREMLARRCRAEEGRAPDYSFAELATLLGVSTRRARASINRLVDAGLLEWSEHAIAFPEPPADFDPGLDDSIGRGRGSLAIPRRILRLLAAGARPALIVTVLGILLRCLSRRRDGFEGRGRVKASWIARTFGVEIGRVKLARVELVALGWIEPQPSQQWAMNRWGKPYRIRLDWQHAGPDGRRSPPPGPPHGPRSLPPDSDQDPLREENQNQEPAPGGPAGARLEGPGRGMPTLGPSRATPAGPDPSPPPAPIDSRPVATRPASGSAGAGPLPAPRLDEVRPEDLEDTGRLLELHRQAVARGLVSGSEADRLRFVGAAEHALAIGRGNPPGLFAYLIRGGLWRYVTMRDEDRAHVRIKAQLAGPAVAASVRPSCGSSVRMGQSKSPAADAELVRAVRAAAIRAGIYRDPFVEFARRYPDWSRERWDRAMGGPG